MRKGVYLLTIIMLLIGISPVLADTNNNIVDFSKKGTITITLSDGSGTDRVEGANIKIYKLADAYSKNSNLAFSYHEDLKDCKNSIEKNDLNEEVFECIHNSSVITKEGITDSFGYVSFDDLDLGLYLIEQINKVSGYSKIDSFVVYIPQFEEDSWVYKVDATPKVDIIRLFDLTVRKVWNVSSDSDTPNEVTVELLLNGKTIDTVILNKENNWIYTWNQIEKSDKYLVREINIPVGYTPTYQQKENMFIITNTKTLVQTGRISWIINLLVVVGLLFIMIGLLFQKKESND